MIQVIRRTDGSTETPGGHPLPLTGKPLTETPVVVKKEGAPLKAYPEVCIPAREELGVELVHRCAVGRLLRCGDPGRGRLVLVADVLVE